MERHAAVHRSLDALTPRERTVVSMHFGIGERRAYTLQEIGQKFQVTRERIRQIELQALQKLRHPVRSQALREFVTPLPHGEKSSESPQIYIDTGALLQGRNGARKAANGGEDKEGKVR